MPTVKHRSSLASISTVREFLSFQVLGDLLGGHVTGIAPHAAFVSTPQGKFVLAWPTTAPDIAPPLVMTLDRRLACAAVDDSLWRSLVGEVETRTAVYVLMVALADLNANPEVHHDCC